MLLPDTMRVREATGSTGKEQEYSGNAVFPPTPKLGPFYETVPSSTKLPVRTFHYNYGELLSGRCIFVGETVETVSPLAVYMD